MPSRRSKNCPTEAGSNTCELTHPARLHGEMMYRGTLGPGPPRGGLFHLRCHRDSGTIMTHRNLLTLGR